MQDFQGASLWGEKKHLNSREISGLTAGAVETFERERDDRGNSRLIKRKCLH